MLCALVINQEYCTTSFIPENEEHVNILHDLCVQLSHTLAETAQPFWVTEDALDVILHAAEDIAANA